MSIGKFFILAILLPMATIYLTLALKGHNENLIEEVKEEQETQIESKEIKSIEYVETPEESEFSLKDDFIESRKSSAKDDSSDSIESMIRSKKYNYSNSVESEDYNNFDEVEQKKPLKSNRVISTNQKMVTVIGVKNVEAEKIIKNSTSKNILAPKKVVAKNQKVTRKTKSKPKPEKKRVVSSKKTTKVKKPQVAKSNNPNNAKSNKKVITNPDTTKQIVFKKQAMPEQQKQQKPESPQSEMSSLSTSDSKYFGDPFDDGNEDEIDSETSSLSTPDIKDFDDPFDDGSEDEIVDEEAVDKNLEDKTETQERFTSNP